MKTVNQVLAFRGSWLLTCVAAFGVLCACNVIGASSVLSFPRGASDNYVQTTARITTVFSLTLLPAFPNGAEILKDYEHPPVNFSPGEEYGDEERKYQGIPTIERAPGGRLWVACYAGKVWEDRYNYILAVTSADDGETWSDIRFVIDPDGDGPLRASDPCLWLDTAGRLWLFWDINKEWDRSLTLTFAMTTDNPDDQNPVWSKPRVICKGVTLNKPIIRGNGEWMLPTAIWNTDYSCRAMVSLDKGLTWSLRGSANVPPNRRNCDEPMIVERQDGSLFQLVRIIKFGIGESVSLNDGRTWTEVEDYLPDATSRFYLRRLISGRLILIKHGPLDRKIGRSQLTAYLSEDEGRSWIGGLTLDERSTVSYPDGTQSPDGIIRVVYDWNRGEDKNILMAVFTEEDILAGKFCSSTARQRVLVNKATGINPRLKPKLSANENGKPLQTNSVATFRALVGENGLLKEGATIFSDRDYRFHSLPDQLNGKRFIKSSIDGVKAVCDKSGYVYVITPLKGRNADSLESFLMKSGFEKCAVKEFVLFLIDGKEGPSRACSVFQKHVNKSEMLELAKWGIIVFAPPQHLEPPPVKANAVHKQPVP